MDLLVTYVLDGVLKTDVVSNSELNWIIANAEIQDCKSI